MEDTFKIFRIDQKEIDLLNTNISALNDFSIDFNHEDVEFSGERDYCDGRGEYSFL